jgi:hypothetical protein
MSPKLWKNRGESRERNFDRLLGTAGPIQPVADIVQCGYGNHKALAVNDLAERSMPLPRKLLILRTLTGLAHGNWLIHNAA